MPERQSHLVLAAAAAVALLAGCSSVSNTTHSFATAITPYKVEVVQGNFVSKEQVDALQKGMNRDQVRQILGTPLVTDLFHTDRWDYVFTLKRQGVAPQRRHLTVFFQGDTMDRVEGDTMPSEAEFVTTLDNRSRGGKIPRLEATEQELKSFSGKQPAAPDAAPAPSASAAAQAPATNYPPLESLPR